MAQLGNIPPQLQQLLAFPEPPRPIGPLIVKKGSVTTFNYIGQTKHIINDPYPLVLVSDIFDNKIRGVNLHYLTFPYLRMLINYFDNPTFSYRYIKGDSFLVSAFRSYRREGISQVRMLDTTFLKNLLTVARGLDVVELEQIIQQIRMAREQARTQLEAVPGELPI